ncbi:MAG: Arm DNA-binding domain-containing protein [Rhodospirillaceae bacterium]
MVRARERLTALTVRNLSKPGLYADGDGLYLQVTPVGAKTWVFRFRLGGKRRHMGLGAAGDRHVTLDEARNKAADTRRLVREGLDSIESRRGARIQALADTVKAVSFKDAAEAYIRNNEGAWTNYKHAAQWTSTLVTMPTPSSAPCRFRQSIPIWS